MIMTTYQAAIQSEKLRKGPWLEEEDERLATFVTLLGERKWDSLARVSGLNRSGKSCRLRWLNYLRPNIKRGHISEEEEQIIIQLHKRWGNRWSRIARRLPGRTDNEIKNYWRSHLRKKIQAQEEANLLCKVNNDNDDLSCQKADHTNTWKFVLEDYTSLEPTTQDNNSALDNSDLSSFSHLNSPYESRLYDWTLELSSCQDETEIHGSCNGLSSCFCYFAWHSDDTDATTTFDSWGSLWDMN